MRAAARRPLIAIGCCVAALGPAAVARAQSPTTTQPPATTTPPATPAPAPTPAAAKLGISFEKVGHGHATLVKRRVRVRGALQPFVAGEKVTVTLKSAGKTLRTVAVTVRPSSTGKSGGFEVGYSARRVGRITATATHAASAAEGSATAKAVSVDVLPTHLKGGAKGSGVRAMQRRLAALHYAVGRRGKFDARTARAVLAFRKMTRLGRTSTANKTFFRKLASGAGSFKVRHPDHGRHVEGDLTHQVLALIGNGGKVERLFPMSSGKASTPTVLGSFRVYSKTPGVNSEGMVDSSYFIRGYAIHGYASVPTTNASHGCMRVPIPEARGIFNWVRIGTPVDVYYR